MLEWHTMTPVQQRANWGDLVAWVIWLHDRYELSQEEKLPICWAQHPGLIEELWALRTWRQEIYTTTIGGAVAGGGAFGQAARYWHGELRQVLHAASTQYAAGCRAAHRSATSLTDLDPDLHTRWQDADPLTGIPTTLLNPPKPAGAGPGLVIGGRVLREALHHGRARLLSETVADYIHYDGTWWTPAPGEAPANEEPASNERPAPSASATADPSGEHRAGGHGHRAPERWQQVTDTVFSADLDRAAAQLRTADDAVQHPGGAQPRP